MAGIYIHVDLPADAGKTSLPGRHVGSSYAEALCAELNAYSSRLGRNETIDALSFGGAVHCLPFRDLQSIMQVVFSAFDGASMHESGIDVLPGPTTLARLEDYRALGFDRINILAGSFFEDDLARLEVDYEAHQVQALVKDVLAAGFRKAGVVLALDIEDQPHEYWGANLEKAVHLGFDHIVLETASQSVPEVHPREVARCLAFPVLVEEPSARYAFAMEYLANTDFEHYALSSFARPDSQSRYTQLHLEHANLLGIGPGVHSFWWYGSSQSRAHRWSNIKNIARYQSLLAQHELPLETQSLLTLDQLANEYIVLGLPSLEGLNLELLETDYGVDLFTERIDEIAWLESQALIEPIRNDRIRLTSAGKLQAIDVMSRLLIDD